MPRYSIRIAESRTQKRWSYSGTPVFFKRNAKGEMKPTNGKYVKLPYSAENSKTKYNVLVENEDTIPQYFEDTLRITLDQTYDYFINRKSFQ
jgi:hypothetical protein